MLPEIFCIKHLNWILKTTDLTDRLEADSGRLDERPTKNGETDRVNPQTRQRGSLADRPRENDRENGGFADQPDRRLSLSCTVLAHPTDTYTHASGHFTCRSRFKYICNAYILSLTAKSEENGTITIILLLSVINRQAGATVEEGFKCLFT